MAKEGVITLLGQPKSTNHIYKMTCRGRFASMYMSKKGKDIKEDYQWQLKSQWKQSIITESLELDIKLYFGTKRKSDIDNYNKLLLDAMTGIVFEDDHLINKMTLEKFYDKEDPRIEVIVL